MKDHKLVNQLLHQLTLNIENSIALCDTITLIILPSAALSTPPDVQEINLNDRRAVAQDWLKRAMSNRQEVDPAYQFCQKLVEFQSSLSQIEGNFSNAMSDYKKDTNQNT